MGHVDLTAMDAVHHLERVHHGSATSVKMSVAGHEVCIFNVTVCARDTCGIATAAAPVTAAPVRNLRRDVVFCEWFAMSALVSLLQLASWSPC
jgi:hypothetical protein